MIQLINGFGIPSGGNNDDRVNNLISSIIPKNT